MLIEISVMEAYQLQAALEDRLVKLEADPTEADSLEAAMVKQGLTYTGSIHARLLVLLYGEDEPDELAPLTGDCRRDAPDWCAEHDAYITPGDPSCWGAMDINREGMPEFNGAFR